jgi:hypothetical protein
MAEAEIDPERDAEISSEFALHEAIDAHEDVDWRHIPGISTSEAAAWTARLIKAADQMPLGAPETTEESA